jgi:hypothetical protein
VAVAVAARLIFTLQLPHHLTHTQLALAAQLLVGKVKVALVEQQLLQALRAVVVRLQVLSLQMVVETAV